VIYAKLCYQFYGISHQHETQDMSIVSYPASKPARSCRLMSIASRRLPQPSLATSNSICVLSIHCLFRLPKRSRHICKKPSVSSLADPISLILSSFVLLIVRFCKTVHKSGSSSSGSGICAAASISSLYCLIISALTVTSGGARAGAATNSRVALPTSFRASQRKGFSKL
jgi:hypothetical protein